MKSRKTWVHGEIPYTAPPSVPRDDVHYVDPKSNQHEHVPFLCVSLYILCIMLGCLGDWKDIAGGIGTYCKAASLGAAGLALLMLVKTGRSKELAEIGRFALVFIAPLLITLLLSLVIWVVNSESISAISRGAQKLIFQCVNIISVIAGAYLFKERLPEYFFYGLIAGNAGICLLEMKQYGIVSAVTSLIKGLTGGDTYGFMRAIEIHDITFAAGLFAMYFFTAGWKIRKNRWLGLIALVFFVIGFKRIALLGCALAFFIWWFIEFRKHRTRLRLITMISVALVLIAFIYVISIKIGLFNIVMNALDIDTMGRNRIYAYLDSFYVIDPTFIGYGFEYTVAMLRGMRASGEEIIHVTGIHNDILKLYIELGFWGFWLWTLYVFVYQTRWYMKRFGERAARLMLIVNLYAFITYMTDNTTYYFWMSMAMRAIMIGYAMSGEVVAGLERERRETGILTDADIRSLSGDAQSG